MTMVCQLSRYQNIWFLTALICPDMSPGYVAEVGDVAKDILIPADISTSGSPKMYLGLKNPLNPLVWRFAFAAIFGQSGQQRSTDLWKKTYVALLAVSILGQADILGFGCHQILFSYIIGIKNPNWRAHIQRGGSTTNQISYIWFFEVFSRHQSKLCAKKKRVFQIYTDSSIFLLSMAFS